MGFNSGFKGLRALHTAPRDAYRTLGPLVGKWVQISNVTYKIVCPCATTAPLVKQQTRPYCVHTPNTGQASMCPSSLNKGVCSVSAVREKCRCCDRRIHSVQAFVLFTDSMMGMDGHSLKCTGVGFQMSSPKLSDIQQRKLAAARRRMIHYEQKRGRS